MPAGVGAGMKPGVEEGRLGGEGLWGPWEMCEGKWYREGRLQLEFSCRDRQGLPGTECGWEERVMEVFSALVCFLAY